MQILIYSCVLIYCAFYLFEAPIRYGLHMVGADFFIFARDIILWFPLTFIIFTRQFLQKKLHPAFYIFALLMVVHGLISFLNIGSVFVVFYSVKLLFNILAGVILAPYLMKFSRSIIMIIFIAWFITFVGVFVDKYDFFVYPWTGMATTINDIQVAISRDWQIVGEDKRAGGFMRSSINAAIIEPILAFIIIFNLHGLLPRLMVMMMTSMTLYWTTQKASIFAFIFVCGLLLMAYKRSIPALKTGISLAFILMIILPIILPQFTMPNANGVFSLGSFYMRVEEMWPQAWMWIERHEIFPFGVGLGGIGGAQRFYALENVNYVDNLFIFLYAYFGVFAFVYMGWVWWVCMRVSNKSEQTTIQALSIVLFISFYGIALSMIEDQMAALFLGAAVAWIAGNHSRQSVWQGLGSNASK